VEQLGSNVGDGGRQRSSHRRSAEHGDDYGDGGRRERYRERNYHAGGVLGESRLALRRRLPYVRHREQWQGLLLGRERVGRAWKRRGGRLAASAEPRCRWIDLVQHPSRVDRHVRAHDRRHGVLLGREQRESVGRRLELRPGNAARDARASSDIIALYSISELQRRAVRARHQRHSLVLGLERQRPTRRRQRCAAVPDRGLGR